MTIHARAELARQYTPKIERERIARELSEAFANNNVDLFVLNGNELTSLWIGTQRRKGQTDQVIEDRFFDLTGLKIVVQSESYELVKTFGATAIGIVQDGQRIAALASDMHRSGNILGSYYTKVRNGRTYVIFQGHAGLRKVLTGTRYLSTNVKLIQLGVGLEGLKAVSRSGAMFAIYASVTLNTIQWLFDPEFGWSKYTANITADVMKAVLAAAAGYLVGGLLVGAASIAIVPVAVGVAVTIAVGYGLHMIDKEFGLTEKLASATSLYYHIWGAAGSMAMDAIEQKRTNSARVVKDYVYGLVEETGEALLLIASEKIRQAIDESIRKFLSPVRRF